MHNAHQSDSLVDDFVQNYGNTYGRHEKQCIDT